MHMKLIKSKEFQYIHVCSHQTVLLDLYQPHFSHVTFIYLSILHMLSMRTNSNRGSEQMTLSCDCCVNLTYVELKRVIFSTSRIPVLFTNGVAQGDVNESLYLHVFFFS